MVHFVSLVFKMSATEIVSVGIELISLALAEECRKILEMRKKRRPPRWWWSDVCFMIILRLVVPKTLMISIHLQKMFPYAHLSTQKTFSNFASTAN